MAELEKFKPNIDKVIERCRKFLKMEDTGWPLLYIQILIYSDTQSFIPHHQFVGKDIIEVYETIFKRRLEVDDDMLPVIWVNLGPAMMAAFMGCPIRFNSRTSWSEPILNDYSEIDNVYFDPDNRFFKGLADLLRLITERVGNDIAIGLPDVGPGSPADLAAAIRGRERFLVDLYRRPHDTKKLMEICVEAYVEIVKTFLESISHPYDGTTTGYLAHWMPPRASSIFQEDITVFLSPKMYHEHIRPFDEMVTNQFENSIFHCDGAWHIIPDLLEIDEIGTIQFVNPPKGPHILQVEALYGEKRKKPIIIQCENLDIIKRAIQAFGCKGLRIDTHASSVKEATKIVKAVKEFSQRI